MSKTLFFYDLETSGFSPIDQRIMQFAGQRTDFSLKTIGEPYNFLIKLTDEILPDPSAILITGITPQKTISDGITEAEFLKIFTTEISTPGTIFTGFNTVRFDDEFMRYLHYRNFYDPYEWQWKDGRGKWDLLDVARMTRALRPEGINWPSEKGVSTNRLELLTKANNIAHEGAHDALSDVIALIELTKLLRDKQPKLFDYLLDIMGDKNKINNLVNEPKPFVYTSSKYPSEHEKTTVVGKLSDHPKRNGVLVFDLRYSPQDFIDLSVDELVEAWRYHDETELRLPVKTLQFNRCPAIAPLGVLDKPSQERIHLDIATIETNFNLFNKVKNEFSRKVLAALDKLDKVQEAKYALLSRDVDGMLYDEFFDNNDKKSMQVIRNLSPEQLKDMDIKFKDSRLNRLLPLYKARNYKKLLSNEEIEEWEKYRKQRLLEGNENSKLSIFVRKIDEINKKLKLSKQDRYLIDELSLYGESIIPFEN